MTQTYADVKDDVMPQIAAHRAAIVELESEYAWYFQPDRAYSDSEATEHWNATHTNIVCEGKPGSHGRCFGIHFGSDETSRLDALLDGHYDAIAQLYAQMTYYGVKLVAPY